MDIKEKVAYIKGLMEGMKFDTGTDTGKLISGIVDALGAISDEIAEMREDVDTLNDYCDELDHDLGDLEEEVCGDDECQGCHHHDFDDDDDWDDLYDDDDDDDEDEDDDDDDDDDEDEDDDEELELTEVVCPECGDKVYYDESLDGQEITCPNCGGKIKLEKK